MKCSSESRPSASQYLAPALAPARQRACPHHEGQAAVLVGGVAQVRDALHTGVPQDARLPVREGVEAAAPVV